MDALGRIVGSDKLEKTKVRRNLVGARSFMGLGALGRSGLKIPTSFFSGLLTA